MKIRMSKTYTVYELYDTIEINKEDYPELIDLTDEEALEYLKDNLFDFEIDGGEEEYLGNEFEFNRDIVKDKQTNEEYNVILIKD